MDRSEHSIYCESSIDLHHITDESIDLVVTSPPYPMIEMWDEIMSIQNIEIRNALENGDGPSAFELMHKELDKIWEKLWRVVKPGGFACINIGDATRTIHGQFALYPNHARILQAFLSMGWTNLPNILWRKQTNAPNKFMGSGMLPAGAYVTLEHEWILIFRKENKRKFTHLIDKDLRNESAYFWEERNVWFSDLWDLKGAKQILKKDESRKRSAAFPFEIPYRLINMYSVKGDKVLDPFLGTGTTTIAAIASQRNSIGYEIDESFGATLEGNILDCPEFANAYIQNRLKRHADFVKQRIKDSSKKEFKYFNESINLPVMTSQERGIEFSFVDSINKDGSNYVAVYSKINGINEQISFTSLTGKKNPTLFD